MPDDEEGHQDVSKTDPAVAAIARDERNTGEPVTSTARLDNNEVDEFGLPLRKSKRRSYEDDDEFEDAVETPDVEEKESTSVKPIAITDTNNTAEGTVGTTLAQSVGSLKDDEAPATHCQTSGTEVSTQSGSRIQDHMAEQESTKTKETSDLATSDLAQDAALSSSTEAHRPGEVSEWSHQQLAPHVEEKEELEDDGEWQEMPAFATHTVYDDWGKIIARETAELDEEDATYGHLGGAGKGYTKVQLDEDAQSATSMDDTTAYLFKENAGVNTLDEDEEGRDMMSQMEATKDMLTEGQRIAYVGVVRLSMIQMFKELDVLERTRGTKKHVEVALEAMKMWGQKMMVRLYSHMEIDAAEQMMIEQLAEHGVEAADLTPTLMHNARVNNPAAEQPGSAQPSESSSKPSTPQPVRPSSALKESAPGTPMSEGAPPAYEEDNPPDYLSVKDPSQLGNQSKIDIDLRWTVLCDLFLVLIADSVYDSRSRTLLEKVGSALAIPWIDICRFEKRITDALEMQEASDKENWNEDEHLEQRKKSARNRRLMMMGLATVGGGLVIGLSAGLLAPVIGAGLAAGFSTIGIAGTSSFLAGAGGAAIITTTGVLSGGTVAVRASNRRMGAVKTFEYRPLHNNKRVNLIVTVAGWMTGKVDDVRLPYSTVDPIMGDMYSVHWEPEMLQSMGQTINILATEALTQGLQQVLGSTILMALMASLQLPIVLTKLSYLIDNPWSVSQARADLAGLILADSLIDRNLGVRPVTLCGFSLGSRVIFSCLKELARRGAFGLVQNVYLFGSPLVVKKDEYIRARTIVSGRFVNGYASNDWILGYLFRATSGGIMRVAGLAPVEIPGIENHDVTSLVPGHMAYRSAMPKLLREVGWVVESLEFSEIEDPDPENHEKRQRELINEIEEARRKLETKPSKRGLKALFSRSKKQAEKKEWETYEERPMSGPSSPANPEARFDMDAPNGGVLFDIDAIRAEAVELAAQGIEVKEIKSTLPPMKLSIDGQSPTSPRFSSFWSNNSQSKLRHSKSYSASLPYQAGPVASSSTGALHNGSASASNTALSNGSNNNNNKKASSYDYDEYDDHHSHPHANEDISMTFESPEIPSAPYQSAAAAAYSSSSSRAVSGQRPALRTSNTMPVGRSSPKPGHSAWTDEDEHGHREEVSMTFE